MAKKARKRAARRQPHDDEQRGRIASRSTRTGDESFETGRYLVTFKEGAVKEGAQALSARGLRSADARDFAGQTFNIRDVAGADSLVLPEIGVAVVGGSAFAARGMSVQAEIAADSPIRAIEPEYFVFAQSADDYLRGFARAMEVIAKDLGQTAELKMPDHDQEEVQVIGATWGLTKCKVPPSPRSGAGIKVAVLDTGMDLGHPDFSGRMIVGQTFVGQPVQDLHSHGTHNIGTACGPQAPAGTTPRYGIGYNALIFAGKVLSNSGASVGGSVLAGMNWAIANRCAVIFTPLGSQAPVQAAYTAAGTAALNNGGVIIAPAGSSGLIREPQPIRPLSCRWLRSIKISEPFLVLELRQD